MRALIGRGGSWVDQVQQACSHAWFFPGKPDYLSWSVRDDDRGPTRGGGGGGPIEAPCSDLIVGLQIYMTPDNRQVKYIDVTCLLLGVNTTSTVRFNKVPDPTHVNTGGNRPSYQGCPGGEAGVGLRGRYGQDVNAISLICAKIDMTLAPPGTR